jgi:hypothetical protein
MPPALQALVPKAISNWPLNRKGRQEREECQEKKSGFLIFFATLCVRCGKKQFFG